MDIRSLKMMKAPLLALAAAAACVLASSPTANAADTFQFNQAGTGAPGTTISGFNLSASNALAVGGNAAVTAGVGQTFQLYVQGQLGNLIAPGGGVINIAPGQITAVASITEVVTSVNAATGTATFAVNPIQAAGSGLSLYASPVANLANPATGAGFITGAPILTATAVPSPQGTLNNFTNSGGQVAFNQSGNPTTNPTPFSVNGSGVSTIDFNVTSTVAGFFPVGGPALISLHLGNAGSNTPFTLVAPSALFTGPSGNLVVPNLGTVNGATVAAGGGPDIQFQVSGSVSGVTAVPEPSSVVLMGLGLVGVVAVARRKRAQVA